MNHQSNSPKATLSRRKFLSTALAGMTDAAAERATWVACSLHCWHPWRR
jgi:hypothetical protein